MVLVLHLLHVDMYFSCGTMYLCTIGSFMISLNAILAHFHCPHFNCYLVGGGGFPSDRMDLFDLSKKTVFMVPFRSLPRILSDYPLPMKSPVCIINSDLVPDVI